MTGPVRPHTTQTNQPASLNRGATIAAATPALTGLACKVDSQTPAWEPGSVTIGGQRWRSRYSICRRAWSTRTSKSAW
jgi:hypothetical protein